MPKKKSVKRKKANNKLGEEIEEVEAWILQRRRFFWKLLWVALFIIFLIYLSNTYLRISGAGI